MTGVREPKDEEELAKARLAILHGKGQTIEQVIANIIQEKPSMELVEAVTSRIAFAKESEEVLNLEELIQSIISMQTKWA
ncbi:MAG: hypothetical protein ISR22_07080 [Candidatus Poseidoniaceae archaeon]|nr:hypothetical protein [Euryarchaeota archaeon]MBL6891791.1 hypothetical protein [Candidatus Poseidoniaceae archaeon]RAH07870.1 MAG: hypothetical protein CBC92_000750 [Euryarchaeota archaeon TMED132]|tara:strand:+ start:7769 stop:8008 length:240 start_codon:yes stop_codon:yes gene_type:complete